MASNVEFEDFVVARSPALLRSAYLLVGDRQLAEDLLQTSLTKAWFAWRRIKGDPEPYVRRILVTTSVSWWRKRWTHERPTATIPEPGPSEGVEWPADGGEVWVALGRLTRRQRAVVVLRYVEDRSVVETAELMGCSVGTVKSQCHQALAKLRADGALAAEAVEATTVETTAEAGAAAGVESAVEDGRSRS
jgi:RNA polymerase sigma-70 factor (sigma-E family)